MSLFRLDGSESHLRLRLESDFGCLDQFSSADDLHRVLDDLRGAKILKCPDGLEIIVYPSAVEERDVALITVFSNRQPTAHVVAASEEMRKLATPELWEGEDMTALTLEIVEGTLALANGAIAAVRKLEADGRGSVVAASASCPRCGVAGQLRFEYRYNLLGLAADGSTVFQEGGELTDIFCHACGGEVDDVLGPEGPVLAGAGSERCA